MDAVRSVRAARRGLADGRGRCSAARVAPSGVTSDARCVGEHRATLGPAAVACAAVASTLHGLVVQPRMLTWGATRGDAPRSRPGEELIPGGDGNSTMATTLPAPPSEAWPWDRLDNSGRPSADRVVARWQVLQPGQRRASVPRARAWFTVAVLEPERTLVLRSNTRLPFGSPFDPSHGTAPVASVSSVWGFHLEPAGADTASSSARTVEAARACSRGRLTRRSGNRPTSSCRPASSATCARDSPRPREHLLPGGRDECRLDRRRFRR